MNIFITLLQNVDYKVRFSSYYYKMVTAFNTIYDKKQARSQYFIAFWLDYGNEGSLVQTHIFKTVNYFVINDDIRLSN